MVNLILLFSAIACLIISGIAKDKGKENSCEALEFSGVILLIATFFYWLTH